MGDPSYLHRGLIGAAGLLLFFALTTFAQETSPESSRGWSGGFPEDWKGQWPLLKGIDFGEENLSVLHGAVGDPAYYLRVKYPRGSWSPKATREAGLPVGGVQFYSPVCGTGVDEATLSYSLRFSNQFPFGKGGKLPGLYGGKGNTGGKIPNGTDGFSTRFMWVQNGAGVIYPYLPTSVRVGSTFGRGTFYFKPGIWHRLEQHVRLNTPGSDNGEIDVVLDGKPVFQQAGLRFRDVSSLKINGILFSTFFGGADESWAAASDCFIDFADFTVR
jgi:hypothetical protein